MPFYAETGIFKCHLNYTKTARPAFSLDSFSMFVVSSPEETVLYKTLNILNASINRLKLDGYSCEPPAQNHPFVLILYTCNLCYVMFSLFLVTVSK